MADALTTYRTKRDFKVTPEPRGGGDVTAGAQRFVIQKHWASHLHYDFRLELNGTMKSWAVPKGPSLDPAAKRMAVQVEDHPIAYNSFEGQIPAGQYGAGKVIIWDRGYWTPVGDAVNGYASGKLKFDLHGHKLHGRWTLVRMHGHTEKQVPWLLIKENDTQAHPGAKQDIVDLLPDSVSRDKPVDPPHLPGPNKTGESTSNPRPSVRARSVKASLPAKLSPQLATLIDIAPVEPGEWIWELKFDGYRLLARIEHGKARLFTRNGLDWTDRMPGVAAAIGDLQLKSGWIDGEVVVVDSEGRPDFQALQNAFDERNTSALAFYAFDMPYADGRNLTMLSVVERREALRAVVSSANSDIVRFSECFDAPATDLLASACKIGFEGLIGKRKSAAYASVRNSDWVKLKCKQRQEFLIGGYTDPQGSRIGFGSLLLGTYAEDGSLLYCGNVGTGFSEGTLEQLSQRMLHLSIAQTPFADKPPVSEHSHWLKPVLVAEIEFAGWTRDGRVRHSVFRGLREDKSASSVSKETPIMLQSESTRTTGGAGRSPARSAVHATETALLSGVRISHPDRVVDPTSGTTKLDVVRYYAKVAQLMLEHLEARPVSLVRAPDGIEGQLFFQKHMESHEMDGIALLDQSLDEGHAPLIEVTQSEGLLSAAQMNVIEFHSWNARKDRIDRPDRMTFDLDPGEDVSWEKVQEAANLLRVMLQELGLPAFLKTSGGKGLHVVVPVKRLHSWEDVKGFSKAVVQHLADTIPTRFVVKSGPKNRVGKIFVDYLRNGRGATTVSAWSARARPGMGISVPVAWSELNALTSSAHWTLANVDARLRKGNSPWDGYSKSTTSLGSSMRALGYKPDADAG